MRLEISGMHCQACVRRVEKALSSVADVKVRKVEIGSAELEAAPPKEAAVLEAVRKAGYEPQVAP